MDAFSFLRRQSDRDVSDYDGGIARKLVASLLLIGLAFGAVGCGQGSSGTPGSGAPQLQVVSATDLGTVPTNTDILARDEAYSTAFQGFSVWLYGDTILQKPDVSGRTLLSNTWSYTNSFDASHGITGFQERLDSLASPTMLIEETPEELNFNLQHYGDKCQVQPCNQRWAIWPSAIVNDPASNNGLVFYTVEMVQPNGDFQGIGTSIAIWQNFNQLPLRPSFNPAPVPDHPDLMFTQNEPNFGSAALISNGYLYAYGCGEDTDGLDKGCRLGRVNPATVQDRNTWTFYAGNGEWSSSPSSAVPVFDGLDIVSVSWNTYLQQYVAVYSSLRTNDVMIRTSPNPEGPWSDEIKAFTAKSPTQGNVYDAHAHPEYDADGGQTIYVTYSRSTGDITSEVRLVAVRLQLVIPQP